MAKVVEKEKPKAVAIKVQLDASPSTALYYANYVEVSHSQHDFVLSAARIPATLPPARREELTKTKALTLEAEIQITFPPTLLRPLIAALEQQVALYERAVGKISVQRGR